MSYASSFFKNAAKVAIALTILGFVIFGVGAYYLKHSMSSFRDRHIEATNAIERIYAHYLRSGQWPMKANLTAPGKLELPPDWNYEDDADLGGPVIWVHGPYHMILSYRFSPPEHGQL